MARYLLAVLGLIVLVQGCGAGGGGRPRDPVLDMVLKSPDAVASSAAGMKNDEGVSHFVQSHWDASADFFKQAIKADPNMAEAHFNLALALDQMGNHPEASEHFTKAHELGASNPKIAENEILKKHI
jgi:Flp pilus assembly protein TadD